MIFIRNPVLYGTIIEVFVSSAFLRGGIPIDCQSSIAPLLLNWYDENKRSLPWRDISDPYGIWISEIMLQQTRVETVLSYFPRFMTLFPTVQALAAAPEQDLLKAWEGLGYYSRARNLQKAARQIVESFGGQLPSTVPELLTLSGVGPYTAGAIASIAYSVKTPAVDGNVMRVISRLKGIREDITIPSVSRLIYEEASSMVSDSRSGDFNQALMDLGATVCIPGSPVCEKCPLSDFCDAYQAGDADLLPIKIKASTPKQIAMGVGLVIVDNTVLVQQRQEKLLGGLWVFVLLEDGIAPRTMKKHLHSLGLNANYQGELGEAKHVFSHRIWNMRLMHFSAARAETVKDGRWITLDELHELPFPTAMKAAKMAAEKLLKARK